MYKSIESGPILQDEPIFGRPKPIAILQIPVFRTIPDYLAFESSSWCVKENVMNASE